MPTTSDTLRRRSKSVSTKAMAAKCVDRFADLYAGTLCYSCSLKLWMICNTGVWEFETLPVIDMRIAEVLAEVAAGQSGWSDTRAGSFRAMTTSRQMAQTDPRFAPPEDIDWRGMFLADVMVRTDGRVGRIRMGLALDPVWKDVFSYDDSLTSVVVGRPFPGESDANTPRLLTDADIAAIRQWFRAAGYEDATDRHIRKAVNRIAYTNRTTLAEAA